MAYLKTGQGAEAAREFQKIIDRPGWEPYDELQPLAVRQQARAYAIAGDGARAQQRYQEFFALWKNADRDIPALREAQAEYAALATPAR